MTKVGVENEKKNGLFFPLNSMKFREQAHVV